MGLASTRCVKCGLIQSARPICKSCGAVLGNPTSGEPTVPIFQKDITKKQIIGGDILVALGLSLMVWGRGAVGLVGMAICGIGLAYCAKAKGRSLWWSALAFAILILGSVCKYKPKSIIMKRIDLAADIVIGVVLIAVFIWIFVWLESAHQRKYFVAEVRSELKGAAYAQESYFAKNNSYKSCVACSTRDLPGYNKRSPVTLKAEAGKTGFVLTATHEKCKGEWTYQSTTGKIIGPTAIESCKWL